MAQVDKFWTTSGRVDSFAFEKVAANDIDKHDGWLEGVTGGSLTFGYDTDLKVSGSLDISSTSFVENCVIRVHYKPKLGSETKDEVLCTCFATAEDMRFDKGRYTGKLNLRSLLAQYIDDKLRDNFTIGKNKSYKAELKRLVSVVGGGKYRISGDVKDKKCPKAKAFEYGKAPMEVLQSIADSLGGQVGTDANGYMTLKPYITPAKKSLALKLPKGGYSVTLPGVDISDNLSTATNRVAYKCICSWKQTEYVLDKKGNREKYTSGANKGKYKTKKVNKTRVITGRAQVSPTSSLHYSKRGRWVSEIFEIKRDLGTKGLNSTTALNKKFAEIQTEMNRKAASKLSSVSARVRHYTIESYYLPVEIGQVVEFEYVASGINLHVQAMVLSVDMTLGAGARMKITLKHVRYV